MLAVTEMSLLTALMSTNVCAGNAIIPDSAEKALRDSREFLAWLEVNSEKFGKCRPLREAEYYVLCDGTRISRSELSVLFRLNPDQLFDFLTKKGIVVEILCKKSESNTFKKWCKPNHDQKFFKEVSSLHGQFLPAKNTILLHSDAYLGSLIHEYLHYLQFKNNNKNFGRVYKADRVAVQNGVEGAMSTLISKVQALEREGKAKDAIAYLPIFKELTDSLLQFGKWQKIIDERSLFLLYLDYGSEFGASKSDMELAWKNMQFLCHDKTVRPIIVNSSCSRESN